MFSSLPYYSDQDLLPGIASGNADFFRIFFSRYYHKVFAFSLKVTRSVYRAEEISQEVFLKIWVNREQMTGIENPEAWIITITRNLCFNQLKKLAAEKSMEALLAEKQGSQSISIHKQIEDRDLLIKLRQASAQLTPRQQLIYRLSKEKGLRKKEIADTLNISENTVRVHLTNALRKIRQLMERYATAGIFAICFFKKFF
jgi:RNA polymerase sigma-70 factor (family 1)